MRSLLLGLALGLAAAGSASEDPFLGALHESQLESFHTSDMVIAVDHDEQRFQFLLSLSYELLPTKDWGWELGGYELQGLSLAYDGLFDFFLLSRRSQPMVSREQNPGLYLRFASERGFVDLGWFHESNGQVVDKAADLAPLLAQDGYRAIEKVSRAWYYWYLSPSFSWKPGGEGDLRITLQPELRLYSGAQGAVLPAEQDLFWRPSEPAAYIYDYDGLRARLAVEWLLAPRYCNYVGLSADLRTGYNAGHLAQNWSRRFALTVKAWHLPFYAYYQSGYGPYISDYSGYSEGYGIGIRVW